MKRSIILFLLAGVCTAQTVHTYSALDTRNPFTNVNSFASGAILGPTTFAGLSTGNFAMAADGTFAYVTDGTPGNPCAGGGSGAPALRTGGVWQCLGNVPFAGAPSGTCTAGQTSANLSNTNFFICNGGAWTAISAAVGSAAWSAITAGTNTNALVVGSLGSLTTTGTGSIVATTSTGTAIAQTGVDINTSFQVTALHMAAPVPVVQGGTGTATPALVAGTNISITGTWPNNTINSTGGGGLPSGTRGLPLINSNGSTGYATSAAWIDASQFDPSTAIPAGQGCGNGTVMPLSNDAAGKIQKAICALPSTGGVVDARSIIGGTFGSNPFDNPSTGSHTVNQGVLLLGQGTYTVQGGAMFGIPSKFQVWGLGRDNTRLVAGNAANATQLVCLGVDNNAGADGCSNTDGILAFGVVLGNITIVGGGNSDNCVKDYKAQEGSGLRGTWTIGGCSKRAIWFVGNNAQNSGIEGSGEIDANAGSSGNCLASFVNLQVGDPTGSNQGVPGWYNAGHITLNGGSGCTNVQTTAASINGLNTHIENLLCGNSITCLTIGDIHNTSISVDSVIGPDPTHCGGGGCTQTVLVANTGGVTVTGTIRNISGQAQNSAGTIVDLQSTHTITQDPIGFYAIDQAFFGAGFREAGGSFVVNITGDVTQHNGTVTGTLGVTGHTTFEGVTSAGATGTGNLVYGTAPTISAPVITGHPTIEGVVPTGATGTGKLVFDTLGVIDLTNATGLPLTTGVIGILPVANGGTGATSFVGGTHDAFCTGAIGTGTATAYYMTPGSSAVGCSVASNGGTNFGVPLTTACTASHLTFVANGHTNSTGSPVITLMKNGSTSIITCTVATTFKCTDAAHTVSFAANDTWQVQVLTGASNESGNWTTGLAASFQCQ